MEKLLKAKDEIMKEIEEVENTPIEDLIERKVIEYREMITKEAQDQRRITLEELHIGLKYVNRAISRSEMEEPPKEIESPDVKKMEENVLTEIIV